LVLELFGGGPYLLGNLSETRTNLKKYFSVLSRKHCMVRSDLCPYFSSHFTIKEKEVDLNPKPIGLAIRR
jgi:hypothetical protein